MWSYALRREARGGDHTITQAGGAVTYNSVIVSRRSDFWGLKVDGIPPDRTSIVVVLLGRELETGEHTVSRNKAVTRQGEIPGEAA